MRDAALVILVFMAFVMLIVFLVLNMSNAAGTCAAPAEEECGDYCEDGYWHV